MNLLDPDIFRGERRLFARAGRIPFSVNVIQAGLYTDTGTASDEDQVRKVFADSGALEDGREIIPYCGSGIGAAFVAFHLARIGYDDVGVYDGSLTEWAADPELPLVTGD